MHHFSNHAPIISFLMTVAALLLLPVPLIAAGDAPSSCITCHTSFKLLKKNLSRDVPKESALIQGMG